MTPRLDIVRGLAGALKVISVANGYHFNSTVGVGLPDFEAADFEPRYSVIPGADYVSGRDVPLGAGRLYEMSLNVMVFGAAAVRSDEDHTEKVELMIADVRKALANGANPLHIESGTAMKVELGPCRPEYGLARTHGVVGFSQALQVLYRATFCEEGGE